MKETPLRSAPHATKFNFKNFDKGLHISHHYTKQEVVKPDLVRKETEGLEQPECLFTDWLVLRPPYFGTLLLAGPAWVLSLETDSL